MTFNNEQIKNEEKRPTWDEYFISMAKLASTRSVCYRTKCGSVIVKDNSVVSTGYNSSPRYQKNCQEIGFCYRDKHAIQSGTQLELCRASGSHAESNAITLAAKNGNKIKGATIYIYGHRFICNVCKAIISNAGIARVVHLRNDGKIDEFIPSRDWAIHTIDLEENKT